MFIIQSISILFVVSGYAIPRAIVSKAIEAHGGAKNLSMFDSWYGRYSAHFYSNSRQIPADVAIQVWFQHPNKVRQEIQTPTEKIIKVFDGRAGWEKRGENKSVAFDPRFLAEAASLCLDYQMINLYPFLDRTKAKLAFLGRVKVKNRDAWAIEYIYVKLNRKGRIFFDVRTNLLIKWQTTALSPLNSSEDIFESFFEEHRRLAGVLFPAKASIYIGGKIWMEKDRLVTERLEPSPTLFEMPN